MVNYRVDIVLCMCCKISVVQVSTNYAVMYGCKELLVNSTACETSFFEETRIKIKQKRPCIDTRARHLEI